MEEKSSEHDAAQRFADRLALAMRQRGYKQIDLIRAAEAAGKKIGKSQLSQYASGKTLPRHDMLETLGALLGTTPDWLLGLDDPGHPESTQDSPQGRTTEPVATSTKGGTMRTFKKSSKLDNVLYDVRGPVVDEASRMEESGTHVLKLNIGNPAPFGFRTPDEVVYDMRQQLTECEGYSDSKGLFSARKAIMQYTQLKHLPSGTMNDIYTGNGVSESRNIRR